MSTLEYLYILQTKLFLSQESDQKLKTNPPSLSLKNMALI